MYVLTFSSFMDKVIFKNYIITRTTFLFFIYCLSFYAYAQPCVTESYIKNQEKIILRDANKLIPMINHNSTITDNIRLYGYAFDDCKENLGFIYKVAGIMSVEDWFCTKERKEWRNISKEALDYNKKMLDASVKVLKLRFDVEAMKKNICK